MNKNKKLFIIILSVLILPFAFLLSACGQNAKAKRIYVTLAESQYIYENDQITVEWGEKIDLDVSDFNVAIEFEDGTSQNVTGQTDKFTYISNLPLADAQLENGKTPIGIYHLSFAYEGLETHTITINVIPQRVTLQNLIWTDFSNFVYDGNQKSVEIVSGLPNYVSVQYQDNAKTDAGDYDAVATFACTDNHYQLVNNDAYYAWNIQKAYFNQQDLNAIALQNASFVFDNNMHEVSLNQATIPAGLEARIVNGGSAIDAGNYVAEIELLPNNNYNKPNNIFLNWNIQKANINVSNVALVQNSFEYNGQQFSVELNQDTIPQACTAQIISGGTGTEQGTYHAVVEFSLTNNNYNKPNNITLDWEIEKKVASFDFVPTAKDDLYYTGVEQELINESVVNGGTAQYIVKSYNGEALVGAEYSTQLPAMTNAGTYVVGYKIVGDAYHYDLAEQELSVIIAKADVPTYNLYLSNAQTTYTGSEILAEIFEESIPACVQAHIISGGSGVNAGAYRAVVEFTLLDSQNYNAPQNIELDWHILPARLDILAYVEGSQVVLGNDAEARVSFHGFVGADNEANVLSGSPVYDLGGYNKQTSQVGDEYTITVSGFTSNGNYEIMYFDTKFTVLKANVQTTINGVIKNENILTTITQSGTYRLLDDYSMDSLRIGDYLSENLEVILDLGGHILSSSNNDIAVVINFDNSSSGNTLTIRNGTLSVLTHNVAISAEGENTLYLNDNLAVLAHNGIALSVNTENVVVYCSASIQSPYAISYYDGELNITDGIYDGSISINAEDITISGGVFKSALNVYVSINGFITGGKFIQSIDSDYVNKFYWITNEYDFSEWVLYNSVVLRPEIKDVNILKQYYVLDIDDYFDDYELEVICDNYSETTTLSNYSNLIDISTNGIVEDGKIELTITVQRLNKDDLVKTVKLNVVTVENVHFIMDGQHEFVANKTNIYDYQVEVLLSNGEKYQINLADCMSEEGLNDYESHSHQAGEIYTFKISYGGWSGNIDYELKGLSVKKIGFTNPRQCFEYGGKYWEITVLLNTGEELNYIVTDNYFVHIISINKEVEGRPAVDSVDDIEDNGIYTFVITIRLGEEYNQVLDEWQEIISSQQTIQITVVSPDEISSLELESEDIIVGTKPLFRYSTFNYQEFNEQDILDDMSIVEGEFDYTTPGTYNVTFIYHGIMLECTITVHAPDEAKYAYIYNSTYIIGQETQIELSVETWNQEYNYRTPFLLDYITIGTVDLTTSGTYNFRFTYLGLTDCMGSITVAEPTDANWIYFEDTEYELNSQDPIQFKVYYYNNQSEYVTLTRDMIISGNFPDITTAGEYTFNICYANYTPWSDITITIYDPNDTTIVDFTKLFNYRLVWTYSIDGDNITINDNLDGLFIEIKRANGKQEILPVTAEMFSFDRAQAIANIQNDYFIVSYQFSYLDRNSFGVINLVNTADLDDYISTWTLKLIINGQVAEEIRIKSSEEIKSIYGLYQFDDYSYIVPLTLNDIKNAYTNEVQDLSHSGVYNVRVLGEEFVWCIYDLNDADISAYLSKDISVMQNSSVSDLIDLLVGKKININYSYNYPYEPLAEDGYRFSENETYRLLASDFTNFDIDLSKVGQISAKITHNGVEIKFYISVYPNVDGQTKYTYTLDMGFGVTNVDVYDEYCCVEERWYKYRYADKELHIVVIEYAVGYEVFFVYDNNEMTLTPFMAQMLGGDPVVYTVVFQDEFTELKVYNQKFVDLYQYDNNHQLEYVGTMTCEIMEEDGVQYMYIMGMKFKIENDNSLTIKVEGEIIYQCTIEEVGKRAEFRDINGTHIMYYYEIGGTTPIGMLTWVLDTENSVINCYSDETLVVRFIIDLSTGEITDMQINM